MTYSVHEIFYTLQGEGAQSGKAAVFCRFAGCNLWSGREEDRSEAQCRFCDTQFVGTAGLGGGKFQTAQELATVVASHWTAPGTQHRLVVLTGGEPLLQVDAPLIEALHAQGFQIAIETNGTLAAPPGIDWICVSPKAQTQIKQRTGQELKLVFPQESLDPAQFKDWPFEHFYLQPMDGPLRAQHTASAIAYCQAHPQWRLSVQGHKYIGIR
jgi:7-carboxy-7-deazaguanine synthase